VSSILPSNGPLAGGTPVTISGSGFLSTGAVGCKFGTAAVSATFVSAAQLLCAAPAGTGTVAVTVSNNGVEYSATSANFIYSTAITLTGLSVTTGPTGVHIVHCFFFCRF
jgi:hypothetical protein